MSGAGALVTVAVIDSGANVPHPHLPSVAGGVAFDLYANPGTDWVDRLGHGTAVAAAIHEKAPEAGIWAVKVFDEVLATSVPTLIRAIDWATERGFRLVNLSLGTPNPVRAPEIARAVERAVAAGTIIVSAREHDGTVWLPGSLAGCLGVVLDWECPRDEVFRHVGSDGTAVVRASGWPRPIPGVPPQRNLSGISFAVANATGVVARLLAERQELRRAADVLGVLA